jgi:TRAP-type C4-dicarboxylate transport system permease small subunit
MNTLIKFYDKVSALLRILGAGCLIGMTFLTCFDVVGRYFRHPIFGSVELVGFMATLAVAFALPYTHEVDGHIGVEIVIRLFSEKTQAIIQVCTGILSFLFFAVVTWRMFVYAGTMRESGEVSMNLQFPEYIIIYVVAFCFLLFALSVLRSMINLSDVLKGGK